MLIKNVYIHERLKYINITYHHIQNLYKKNQISMNFIFNQNMIVNELIKSLFQQNFKKFIK